MVGSSAVCFYPTGGSPSLVRLIKKEWIGGGFNAGDSTPCKPETIDPDGRGWDAESMDRERGLLGRGHSAKVFNRLLPHDTRMRKGRIDLVQAPYAAIGHRSRAKVLGLPTF